MKKSRYMLTMVVFVALIGCSKKEEPTYTLPSHTGEVTAKVRSNQDAVAYELYKDGQALQSIPANYNSSGLEWGIEVVFRDTWEAGDVSVRNHSIDIRSGGSVLSALDCTSCPRYAILKVYHIKDGILVKEYVQSTYHSDW